MIQGVSIAHMATTSKSARLLPRAAGLAFLFTIACAMCATAWPQSPAITITLVGQSMIRSDIRSTAPAAVPVIKGLLKGDVIFTNLEAAVAEKGQTVHEGRGFLTPPEALDALKAFGFNLLSLAGNHAFDLKVDGHPEHHPRSRTAGKSFMPELGTTWPKPSAPGYLHTPKGTIALIASASGLIAPEASATANRPGVNELRVEAGDKENEATVDLPGAPSKHAESGGFAAHPSKHSLRPPARGPRDRLPA